jgi:hypothetical protein
MLSEPDIVALKIAAALEAIGVEYMIGGSVASGIHGIPRMTQDVDIITRLGHDVVDKLVVLLGEEFYIDADMAHEAIDSGTSFNVIYLATMTKGDLFILGNSAWTQSEWRRRQRKRVGDTEETLYFASPEDMILQKLRWYRMTGERSDRQWGDVQGMLRVQGDALDREYLNHWARELEIGDLLAQSLEDAGFND